MLLYPTSARDVSISFTRATWVSLEHGFEQVADGIRNTGVSIWTWCALVFDHTSVQSERFTICRGDLLVFPRYVVASL